MCLLFWDILQNEIEVTIFLTTNFCKKLKTQKGFPEDNMEKTNRRQFGGKSGAKAINHVTLCHPKLNLSPRSSPQKAIDNWLPMSTFKPLMDTLTGHLCSTNLHFPYQRPIINFHFDIFSCSHELDEQFWKLQERFLAEKDCTSRNQRDAALYRITFHR